MTVSTADLCASLRSFATICEDIWADNAAENGAEDLALLLAAIRDCRGALAEFASEVEKALLAEMGDRSVEVLGLGLVEAKKSIRRTKWDNDGLWRKVVALALDERRLDEGSGEYEPAGDAVARVLAECARPAWRLGPLRARGVDPDEWCTVDESHWAVKLPGRDDL